jgi:hypothetical protein
VILHNVIFRNVSNISINNTSFSLYNSDTQILVNLYNVYFISYNFKKLQIFINIYRIYKSKKKESAIVTLVLTLVLVTKIKEILLVLLVLR